MSVTYGCPSCGQTALGPGTCPICIKSRRYVRLRPVADLGAVPLVAVSADRLPRLPIPGFPQIETAMNGGFVLGSTTLLYGGAGLGKTTLCLKLADRITRVWSRPALYCSTEQSPEQIKYTALRAGMGESQTMVAYEREVPSIERVLAAVGPSFTVIDSLSNLTALDPIAAVTAQLAEMARRFRSAMLLILHETKDGDYNAPRQVEHLVDCMVHLEADGDVQMNPLLLWTVENKYRFGPIRKTATLRFDTWRIPYDPDATPGA